MKTFPFIVVNKNNMKELLHFTSADAVAVHFLGKKMSNYLIIINESHVFNTNEWLKRENTADVHRLQRELKSYNL